MKSLEYYKRIFDFLLAIVLLTVFLLPMIIISLLVKVTSPGPAIYWSARVGRNNKPFLMPKFRSMQQGAPQVATDQLKDPYRYLSPIGSFLRKSSLDELPQLWSIIFGDMSFVGPRPALFNQYELVRMRTEYGIARLRPGLTGWAQINGRDEIPTDLKVELDLEYLNHQSFYFDIKILCITFKKVVFRNGVVH